MLALRHLRAALIRPEPCGDSGREAFGRADASSRIQSLAWLLHEPSCRHKEKGLIGAMAAQGRNTQCWGVQGNARCYCTAEGLWPKGTGMEVPWGVPAPFPAPRFTNPSVPSPVAAPGPRGPVPTVPWLSSASRIWGDLGKLWTKHHTQTASHQLSVAQAVENGLYFS